MAMRDDSPVRQATRIGDAERDTAVAELGDHYAAGRLTLDELHERIGLALEARTRGQLGRVMHDLPSAKPPARPRTGAAQGEPALSDGRRHSGTEASLGRLLARRALGVRRRRVAGDRGGRDDAVEQVVRAERDHRLVAGEVRGYRLTGAGLALRGRDDRDLARAEGQLNRRAALGD